MVLKTIPTFSKMYSMLPEEVQKLLDKCAHTPQSEKWHPEGDVLKHIKIVYERARKTGDINIVMAAIFHDLGKVQTTKKNKHGNWAAHGHEVISARIVEKHKKWIGSTGARYMKVYEIVKEHMRIKQMDKMRKHKQEALKNHKFYPELRIFTECDNMKTLTEEEMKL